LEGKPFKDQGPLEVNIYGCTRNFELLILFFALPGGLELRWEECYGARGEVVSTVLYRDRIIIIS